jgi:hypothetical protein
MSDNKFSEAMEMDKFGPSGKRGSRRRPKTSPGREYSSELQYQTEREAYGDPMKRKYSRRVRKDYRR